MTSGGLNDNNEYIVEMNVPGGEPKEYYMRIHTVKDPENGFTGSAFVQVDENHNIIRDENGQPYVKIVTGGREGSEASKTLTSQIINDGDLGNHLQSAADFTDTSMAKLQNILPQDQNIVPTIQVCGYSQGDVSRAEIVYGLASRHGITADTFGIEGFGSGHGCQETFRRAGGASLSPQQQAQIKQQMAGANAFGGYSDDNNIYHMNLGGDRYDRNTAGQQFRITTLDNGIEDWMDDHSQLRLLSSLMHNFDQPGHGIQVSQEPPLTMDQIIDGGGKLNFLEKIIAKIKLALYEAFGEPLIKLTKGFNESAPASADRKLEPLEPYTAPDPISQNTPEDPKASPLANAATSITGV